MRACKLLGLGFSISILTAACGGGSDDASGRGGDPNPPPGPAPTTTQPGPALPPPPIDAKDVTLTQLVAGFDGTKGFYQASSKRIFSLQGGISSSLARVTVATLGTTTADVSTLPVKGKIPTGHVEVMTYEPSIDRFVLIVRCARPDRIEVVTVALGATDATFTTLTQPSPTSADGYMFNDLFPQGGGTVVAVRGNDIVPLTVTATTATWGTPSPADGYLRGNGTTVVLDAARGRLVSYGKDVYDPGTKTITNQPIIGTMSLAGPFTWTDLSLSNPPPPASSGGFSFKSWGAWDSKGQRLLQIVPQQSTCAGMPCMMQTVYVANLMQNSWTKLVDNFNPPSGLYAPFAVDDDLRRVISFGDGRLSALSIDDQHPLQATDFAQTGDLGPGFTSAAAVLPSGQIVSSDGGAFRVMDPAAAAPRWERFGKASLPMELRYRPSFSVDAATGEVLVFGGASSNSSPTSSALYALAKDGTTLTKIDAATPPPARSSHGAAVAGRTLVVVGGNTEQTSSSGGAFLDDVWTLDRAAPSAAWTKKATLPTPLDIVTLRVASPTEVWALGYGPAAAGAEAALAPIVSVDLATGKTHAVAAHGDAPTRLWSVAALGSCFVGYESGDTVDNSQPNLWRCKPDGDGVVWTKTPLDADDSSIGGAMVELQATSTPDASRAFFVGPTLWSTTAK